MGYIVIKQYDRNEYAPFDYIYATRADAARAIAESAVEDADTGEDDTITVEEAASELKWLTVDHCYFDDTDTHYTVHEVTIK